MRQIKIRDLSMQIKDKCILNSINLDIDEGDTIAILGPNGAGKTTLVNVILNLQRFKHGSVNNDFLSLPAYKIGVHMQESELNGMMKVKEILKLFLFEGENNTLIDKYGLREKLNQRIVTLSGGEKQKLLLVLAFQNNPEIAFIDEITTGLDVQSRESIIGFLKKQMGTANKTLVMVTHYLEEADMLCDKFVFLKQGKLVEFGTKEELYNKYNVHRTIFLETLLPIELPSDVVVDSQEESVYEISVKSDKDLISIMNFISKNNTSIKKYSINDPSLEKLYNKIFTKGDL